MVYMASSIRDHDSHPSSWNWQGWDVVGACSISLYHLFSYMLVRFVGVVLYVVLYVCY
jgi:hypothetical protein